MVRSSKGKKGREIFVFANGSVKKVPRCNIQLCEAEDDENYEEKENKEIKKKENSVNFEEKPDEVENEEERRMITRSMTELERKELERKELEREQIATFWLQIENIRLLK